MNDKVSGVGALSFWEACKSFRITPWVNFDAGTEIYVFNPEADKLILPEHAVFEFLMRAEEETRNVIVTAPTVSDKRWHAMLKSGSEYSEAEIYAVGSVGHHNFTFSSLGVSSSSLEVLVVPKELTEYASYVLEGHDQGSHDLLLNYSKFYKLKTYYPGKEWGALEQDPILKITYDSDALYTIDLMAGGVLVANEVGVSSAEDLPDDMRSGEIAIRVRYKDLNNLYFGKVDLTIVYKSGAVLRPPIEVVKVV